METELVKARWNGPFDAELGPGQVVKPGDEVEVTPADLLSAHWLPVGKDAKQAAKQVEEKAAEQAAIVESPEDGKS